MCGFVGFIDHSQKKEVTIKKMADKIKHRGPDSSGYYVDDTIAMGFRRLSIIDLSKSDQPLYNEDKNLVITFNGEIYNYQTLREELIKKGHIFHTDGDTEVLIHAYEEYGVKMLNKLRGMFAFVIYDKKKQELFGARDFFGIKPFYYATMPNSFLFGSEIKSFLVHPLFNKALNKDQIENYLTFQYSVGKDTFFQNVYKLLPGHYFIYKDGNMDINQYYDFTFDIDKTHDKEYWIKSLESTLEDSIEAHNVSDVEVASFLSSGVDSSYISTASHVDKTFTVGFDNKRYSEIEYAKDVSKNINVKNYHKVISKEEYFKMVPKIQYHMDEPIADPAAVALYFVSNIASKHVKVSLSGDGADEFFGGYNIYKEPGYQTIYNVIPFFIRRWISKVASYLPQHRGLNFLVRRGQYLQERFVGNAFIFNQKERKNLLNFTSNAKPFEEITKPFYDKVKDQDDVTKMQYIDINFWLVGDILQKTDKMSMANSLEVRVPFIDKEVAEISRHIPTEYRVNQTNTKLTFRAVANKVLQDKVANKKKLGFPIPIREWLKEEDTYHHIKHEFKNGSKFFKPEITIKLLDEHKSGKKDNSRKIWTLYTFLIWYKEYFE